MGTDIRCFIEKKVDNEWELHQEFELNRSYQLFYFMCGVRAELVKARGDDTQEPIHPEPLGWPKDICDCLKYSDLADFGFAFGYGGDKEPRDGGHSQTYFQGEDLKKFLALFLEWGGLEDYTQKNYDSYKESKYPMMHGVKFPAEEFRVLVEFYD